MNSIIIYEEITLLTSPVYLLWTMAICQSFLYPSQYMILQTLYHPGSGIHPGSLWPQPTLPVVKRSSACVLSSFSFILWPPGKHWLHWPAGESAGDKQQPLMAAGAGPGNSATLWFQLGASQRGLWGKNQKTKKKEVKEENSKATQK